MGDAMAVARTALAETFGHTCFRPFQERVLPHVFSGRDVLAVAPTGAGKSVLFAIPSLILPGLTVVISPLLSLMKDQVEGLRRRGVGRGLREFRIGNYRVEI